jgi:predicted adenylyl cyclase CyaB
VPRVSLSRPVRRGITLLEIEVKYYLGDESTARELAQRWGFCWSDGTFEVNRIFDFADRRLRQAGALIRVRERGERGWLTYKERTDVSHEGAKVRLEHQTVVEDPGETTLLLTKLGLAEVMRYERLRAGHSAEGVYIVFDHLPGGWFCEIEGDPDAIHAMVRSGDLTSARPITWSYPEIFVRLLRHHDLQADAWTVALAAKTSFFIPPADDPFWVESESGH